MQEPFEAPLTPEYLKGFLIFMPKAKNNAEFYLHSAILSREIILIKKKFGITGYAINTSLHELLTTTDYHYLDFATPAIVEMYADYCMCTVQQLNDFIDFMVEVFPEYYDSCLWSDYSLLRNAKLVESLNDALYAKRSNKPMGVNSIKDKYSQRKLTQQNLSKLNSIEDKSTKDNLSEVNLTKLNLSETPARNLKELKGT